MDPRIKPSGSAHGLRDEAPEFWIISASRAEFSRPLTTECAGEEALAVFGFEEEADMFLDSSGLGSGWRIRSTGIPELLSLLDEPGENAGWVALDPLPRVLGGQDHGRSLMSREEFTDFLIRKAWAKIRWPSGEAPDTVQPACFEESGQE